MAIITKTQGTLEYRVAQGISVPHGFTTRLGGVSQGHLASMNIGLSRGDDPENVAENYRILGNALGFDTHKLVQTKQVHESFVRPVDSSDWGKELDVPARPECDGLITNTPGTALAVFTADCTPILLWDSVTGAVGAVHAGWRGTAADIAGKAVAAMADAFGSKPKHIHAAIGPNIGQCCFETGREVPDALVDTFGEEVKPYIRVANGKYYVNLKEINALALRRRGVENIEISGECTMCLPDLYWSHRYTRGVRGAQGAIIVCKEVQL